VFERIKELRNSGFGSNIKDEGERLITKKGKFNVKKEGLSFLERFNLFHSLINMPTIAFFVCLLIGYLIINLLFTSTYLIIGLEGLQGTTANNDFFDAFYFSSQTLTTVGYGGLYPTGKLISFIASIEAFIGLLSFAVSTGLLYGRFSKPKAKLMFSKKALISPYNDITGLMARVANPKDNQLINASVSMIFSQVIKENDVSSRKFYTLKLEIEKISLFVTSWTVVHPITEESPLYGLTHQEMKERNAEMILLLSAYDESYSQDLHDRTSYKAEDIVANAKFSSVSGVSEGDRSVLRLDKLSDYEFVK